MLSGKFTVKVFEKSGDFSVDQQIIPVSPYDAYFGIGVTPQTSDWGDEYLDSKKEHLLRIVMLDAQGRPLPGREEALVSVYKILLVVGRRVGLAGPLCQKCAQHLLQDIADDPDRRRGAGRDALERRRLRLLYDPRDRFGP